MWEVEYCLDTHMDVSGRVASGTKTEQISSSCRATLYFGTQARSDPMERQVPVILPWGVLKEHDEPALLPLHADIASCGGLGPRPPGPLEPLGPPGPRLSVMPPSDPPLSGPPRCWPLPGPFWKELSPDPIQQRGM